MYEPAATLATVNEAVSVPLVIAQVGDVTASPDNAQLVSFIEKSEPDTLMVDPVEPELGSSEMYGLVAVVIDLFELA